MADTAFGEALVGRMKLRVQCEGSFAWESRHDRVHELPPPGGTIGAGEDVTLCVAGPASDGVSRRHLVLRTAGRQWTVEDCDSSNGTWERDESGGWQPLPAGLAVPVGDGMTLCLADQFVIRFEHVAVAPSGRTTNKKGPPQAVRAQRVAPPELERFAGLLLSRRRADPRDRSVPTAEELGSEFGLERAAVYEWLKRLRALPEVKDFVKGNSRDATADAVATAFPYLLGPR
ncbi:MAG TPA: FHA domain-containing protein [Thermoleophilaceae bacterium]|nr:FHA domain-containing protein [Thermoleophilaceae bacterium]